MYRGVVGTWSFRCSSRDIDIHDSITFIFSLVRRLSGIIVAIGNNKNVAVNISRLHSRGMSLRIGAIDKQLFNASYVFMRIREWLIYLYVYVRSIKIELRKMVLIVTLCIFK